MIVGFGVGIGRNRYIRAPFNVSQWQLITENWETINEYWNI